MQTADEEVFRGMLMLRSQEVDIGIVKETEKA